MDDFSPSLNGLRRFVLKSLVMTAAIACCTYVPYVLIGLWNRSFGGWKSVFFCYAGSKNYTSSYAPRFAVDAFRWRPSPIGILKQDGEMGLVIASPVTEADFLNPANAKKFKALQRRLQWIVRLIGAKQLSLSGILPSVLRDSSTLKVADSRPVVAETVCQAVDQVVRDCFDGKVPALIILGGKGFVGDPTTRALRAQGHDCHVVDPKVRRQHLPEGLSGSQAILIDISRYGAIESYIPQMWSGLVVLNETFPRPSSRNIRSMQAMGIDVYHISGVAGSVRPPLPFGYENAVPCCAAHAPPAPGTARILKLKRLID